MFINPIPAAQFVAASVNEAAEFSSLQQSVLDHYGVNADSTFVDIDEPAMRVHLLIAGDGEPVLFLHGGDGETVDWAPLMAQLQDDVRLIGVDRPGFGLSDRFDYSSVDLRRHAGNFVTGLMDELGLEHATLMAGSMGGFFALVTALDHPARVDRVVLVGMPVGLFREAGPQLSELCGTPGAPEAFMEGISTEQGLHDQYRHMFHINPDSLPELYFRMRLAALQLPGVKQTWATLLRRLANLDGFRPEVYLGAELPDLQQPVLVIWGEHDMAPVEAARQAVDTIPYSRFEELAGSGHLPFLTDPDRTAAAIREFLLDTPLG